jgi:hypothetical protein
MVTRARVIWVAGSIRDDTYLRSQMISLVDIQVVELTLDLTCPHSQMSKDNRNR